MAFAHMPPVIDRMKPLQSNQTNEQSSNKEHHPAAGLRLAPFLPTLPNPDIDLNALGEVGWELIAV
jgi:hypothetical protein